MDKSEYSDHESFTMEFVGQKPWLIVFGGVWAMIMSIIGLVALHYSDVGRGVKEIQLRRIEAFELHPKEWVEARKLAEAERDRVRETQERLMGTAIEGLGAVGHWSGRPSEISKAAKWLVDEITPAGEGL